MTSADVFHALEKILDIETGSISGNESLREELPWDSLAALEFMAFSSKELNVKISGEELAACLTVQDLLRLFGDKLST